MPNPYKENCEVCGKYRDIRESCSESIGAYHRGEPDPHTKDQSKGSSDSERKS